MGARGRTNCKSGKTSFVGRERELAELRPAIDEASRGRGALFLISGEAGIGKTRLADEACAYAVRRGMRSAWGRSWDGGGAPAYWPWIQLLRLLSRGDQSLEIRALIDGDDSAPSAHPVCAAVPMRVGAAGAAGARVVRIAPAPRAYAEPEEQRFRLFDAVCVAIKQAALTQPLMLVVDDLHTADIPSLMMLRFLARDLRGARLVVIGTYREPEMRQSQDRAHLLDELIRESSRLPLSGLNAAEIRALIEVRTGVRPSAEIVEAVHNASGGNPLFADEITRNLASSGSFSPSDGAAGTARYGVSSLIADRLRKLSPEANSVLAIGAAIGAEFELGLIRRITGESPEEILAAIDEAASQGS